MSTVEQIIGFIDSQPKIDSSSFKLLGTIPTEKLIPSDFTDNYFTKKPKQNTENEYWDGMNNWLTYFPIRKNTKIDDRFDFINDILLSFFSEDAVAYSAGIFKLPPEGYIIPHVDEAFPNEMYIPIIWPLQSYLGFENWGRLDVKVGEIYALDLMTKHAVVNNSSEDRYVYNFIPGDKDGNPRTDWIADLLK